MRLSLKVLFQCIAMAVLAFAGSLTAFANQSAIVDCKQGGQVVVTSGLSSTTKVLQSFPSCTITVNIHGGGLATIFSDNVGTPLGNPFTAQNSPYSGSGFFYAANGRYDVIISGGGISAPLTFSDILLNDPASLSGCSQLPALTGDITSAGGTCTTVLPNVASAGTGLKTTINAKGQATGVTTAASTDLSDTAIVARLNAAANFGVNPISGGPITGTTASFTSVSDNGETVAGEIAPDVTGRQLGDAAHRWDAFIRNADISGAATSAGNPFVFGSGTINTIPKFTASSFVGNSGITDNGITVSVSEPLIVSSLSAGVVNKVRYVDSVNSQGWAGSDLGAWINAAAADAGNFGVVQLIPVAGGTYPAIITALNLPRGTRLFFPPGIFPISALSTISNIGVKILGSGPEATYLEPSNTTGTTFTITGTDFEIGDMAVLGNGASLPRTAGAFLEPQITVGYVHNILIQDMFDGFVLQTASANSWRFEHIIAVGAGGNWHNVFRFGGLASGTVTDCLLFDVQIGFSNTTSVLSGSPIVIDSGSDGLDLSSVIAVKGGTSDSNPTVLVKKSGAAQSPSWTRFVNSYIENNTTAVGLEIDSANDFAYSNSYVASAGTGIKITGGSAIRIIGSSILNIQTHGIQVTGGDSITISNNDISDVSQAVTNTSDGINFTAVATNARITGNRIGNQIFPAFTNHQRNGITIPSGASDKYVIADNVITDFGTTDISDGGTGINKTVSKPGTTQTANVAVARITSIGSAPTCSVSGAGASATCGLFTGSTDSFGSIFISAAGAGPAATGTVTITFSASLGTNKATCVILPANASNVWNARATVMQTSSVTASVTATWDNNAVALVAGNGYQMNYSCSGQ